MGDAQMSVTPTFSGELQLAGWSETHTGGCKVTFWLPSSEDLDAFRALTVRKGNAAGHRFMAALVEIGEDEQPVTTHLDEESKHKLGPIAWWMVQRCAEPEFQAWITELYGYGNASESAAREIVLYLCGVNSRKDIDGDKIAATRAKTVIMKPYGARK